MYLPSYCTDLSAGAYKKKAKEEFCQQRWNGWEEYLKFP